MTSLKDYDRWAAAYRALLIGAPLETVPVSFETYPHPVPDSLRKWSASATQGLILYGPPGGGKSVLGIIALREVAWRGKGYGGTSSWNLHSAASYVSHDVRYATMPCWFITFEDLLDHITKDQREDDPSNPWDGKLPWISTLMIDDIGIRREMSARGQEFRQTQLLRHIEWMLKGRGHRLILTTNVDAADWVDAFGERTASRLNDIRRFARIEIPYDDIRSMDLPELPEQKFVLQKWLQLSAAEYGDQTQAAARGARACCPTTTVGRNGGAESQGAAPQSRLGSRRTVAT